MSSLSTTATESLTIEPHPRLRAARVLQFVGILEIILFGLATYAVLRAASMPVEELHQITGANLTVEQLQIVHPQLKTFAAILALSGLVPGAILLLCASGVKQGKAVAALLAILIAGTQLFALGGILIRQLIVAIVDGEPSSMTANVLAIGTPMALLIFVIATLFRLRLAQSPSESSAASEVPKTLSH